MTDADPVAADPDRSGDAVGRAVAAGRQVYEPAAETPIAAQRAMRRAAGINDVRTIDSDHSPFLSRPGELAGILHAIAAYGAPAGLAT